MSSEESESIGDFGLTVHQHWEEPVAELGEVLGLFLVVEQLFANGIRQIREVTKHVGVRPQERHLVEIVLRDLLLNRSGTRHRRPSSAR